MNPRVLYRAASYATDARSSADAVISALTPAAWYRNATGVTQAGGFASQWDDYSGNARHLVQGVGTNQPAYAAGVFTFDGADNFMRATFTLNQAFTVVAVVMQESWTASDTLFDGNTGGSTQVYQNTASPNIGVYAGASINSNPDPAVGSWAILSVGFNGASSLIQTNANAAVTGNAGAQNAGGLTIGARGGGSSAWGHVSYKEFVVFPSAVTGTSLSDVVTALNNALTVF